MGQWEGARRKRGWRVESYERRSKILRKCFAGCVWAEVAATVAVGEAKTVNSGERERKTREKKREEERRRVKKSEKESE